MRDAGNARWDFDWLALLIGGHSAAGKTTAAARIGLSLGVPWLMVDDVRLGFQRAEVTLPTGTEALYLDQQPRFWRRTPREHCDALIDVGHVMSAPLEAIVENHVDQQIPIVIEGDGLLPSLLARPSMLDRAAWIRAAFVVEPEESALRAALVARGGGWVAGRTDAEIQAEANGKWLFGQWLAAEASRHNLAVVEPRPRDTLPERLIEAVSQAR
ncbi:MAG: hypothetical protein OXG43_11465 [Chloroflexi bacterium]|nr:hypothetical protein [Chloroflexota bacterium]